MGRSYPAISRYGTSTLRKSAKRWRISCSGIASGNHGRGKRKPTVMAKLPPEVSDAVAKILSRGPEQVLRDDERALGFEPLKPGDRPWFPASDWDHTNVISIRGKVVRIVAIIAVRKGEGAFSRLITGIAKEGLIPIV